MGWKRCIVTFQGRSKLIVVTERVAATAATTVETKLRKYMATTMHFCSVLDLPTHLLQLSTTNGDVAMNPGDEIECHYGDV